MKVILGSLLICACFFLQTPQALAKMYVSVATRDTIPGVSDDNIIFTRLEVEASYKGGDSAWHHVVDSTLKANKRALRRDRDHSAGECQVQFIVSNTGKVRDVIALNMKDSELAKVLTQMVKDNPNWNPGFQNGRNVNSFKRIIVNWAPSN